MKFVYVDESGGRDQSDVFVMVGLLVDACRLRKKTTDFDKLLKNLLQRHPGQRDELKTKRFINGIGGWSAVPPDERKQFLRDICILAADGGKLFGIANPRLLGDALHRLKPVPSDNAARRYLIRDRDVG